MGGAVKGVKSKSKSSSIRMASFSNVQEAVDFRAGPVETFCLARGINNRAHSVADGGVTGGELGFVEVGQERVRRGGGARINGTFVALTRGAAVFSGGATAGSHCRGALAIKVSGCRISFDVNFLATFFESISTDSRSLQIGASENRDGRRRVDGASVQAKFGYGW